MTALAVELWKLPAFVRRDFLVAWSNRMPFVSDLINLAGQALVFAFIGKMIDTDQLPTFQGHQVTYLEFAAIGIALGTFFHFRLQRVSAVIRTEQLMGTLESLLATPTRTATLQIASVFFDLIYIPLQTALFLTAIALTFGLHLEPAGIFPATAVLLVFIPFVWGLGVVSAAATLTFRRGTNAVALRTQTRTGSSRNLVSRLVVRGKAPRLRSGDENHCGNRRFAPGESLRVPCTYGDRQRCRTDALRLLHGQEVGRLGRIPLHGHFGPSFKLLAPLPPAP
jgi:hypothetical protein